MVDKKQIFIAVVTLAIVVFFVGMYALNREPSFEREEAAPILVDQNLLSGSRARTRESTPRNVVVPEKDSTNVPSGVAKPQVVAAGSPNNDSSYRSFNIQAREGQFTPNTVIVNEGDIVDIRITAVDGNYDFTQPDFGFRVAIPKGTTKIVQFGATASGKFTFYCTACGGLSKGPLGYVIIEPKKS